MLDVSIHSAQAVCACWLQYAYNRTVADDRMMYMIIVVMSVTVLNSCDTPRNSCTAQRQGLM
jgi:hypothetical protein